jgi:sulfotransferase family protein
MTLVAVDGSAPNFLYIGTSKAGSTWLFNALAIHPEVFLAPSKGLYYFDSHFDNGRDWYLAQFADAGVRPAIGEISHSYLSSPEAAPRIVELNPHMRLLACLREPVDRAFSDYLDLVKNGQFEGPFEAALEKVPRLLDRGRYASHLHRYLDCFPREQLHVGLFDDLRADAQRYADEVFAFLGVRRIDLPPAALKSRMPAGTPRSPTAAAAAKSASRLVKRLGLRRLRSQVKRSLVVRQALYRSYADDRPTVPPELAAELRERFTDEVQALDGILGMPVAQRWGYPVR